MRGAGNENERCLGMSRVHGRDKTPFRQFGYEQVRFFRSREICAPYQCVQQVKEPHGENERSSRRGNRRMSGPIGLVSVLIRFLSDYSR